MRICPLCQAKVKEGKVMQPVKVGCTNKKCTMYGMQITHKAFDAGLITGFAKFWELYPRKDSKRDALAAWIKLEPLDDMFVVIITSVVAHKLEAVQWQSKQYIPYPGSFIRGRMWENEIVKEEPAKVAPQFNQPTIGYDKNYTKKVRSTPGSRILTKQMIMLGKALFIAKNDVDRKKIKQKIKEKQVEIEEELAR